MTTMAIRQIVEAFFRRWPIYAAILFGCIGLGVVAVFTSSDEYTSRGSVFVDSQSLVAAQSGVRESGALTFLSPAQFTSQELNGLISTEVFMEAALERAGVDLSDDPALRRSQIERMRNSVGSSANSENLVAVSVTTPTPELSFRVANGVIEEFVRFQIDVDVAESGASEQFFADLVDAYQADLSEARAAVEAALSGVSDLEQLRPDRRLEVERLQEAENLAEDRYSRALANLEASRLATLQTETDVRQSYSVFDPPVVPVEPNGGLLDDVVLVAGFAMLGLVLALVVPMVTAALNRTVVFAEEIEASDHGLPVMAVLPRVHKNETRLAGIEVPFGDSAIADSAEDIGNRTITFVPPSTSGRRGRRRNQAGAATESEQVIEQANENPGPAPATPPGPSADQQPEVATPEPIEAVAGTATTDVPAGAVAAATEAETTSAEAEQTSGAAPAPAAADGTQAEPAPKQQAAGPAPAARKRPPSDKATRPANQQNRPKAAPGTSAPAKGGPATKAPATGEPDNAKQARPPAKAPVAAAAPAQADDVEDEVVELSEVGREPVAPPGPNGPKPAAPAPVASDQRTGPVEPSDGDLNAGGISVVDAGGAQPAANGPAPQGANGAATPPQDSNGVPDDDLPEAMKSLLETTEFAGYRPPDPPGSSGPPPPPGPNQGNGQAAPAGPPSKGKRKRRG